MKRRISKPLTVTLPPVFVARIDQQKLRENRTTSEIIREALRVYYRMGSPVVASDL